MQATEWRDVPGHEGRVQVSSLGQARTLTRKVTYSDGRVATFKGVLLTASRGAHGYRGVNLGRGRGRALLHQIVAVAFLGPKPDWAECINHIDGDKLNNAPSNLEWSTYARNNRHARDIGLVRQHGENCNLTKFSDQIVASVRRVHAKYGTSYRDLADLFDISETTAAQIVKVHSRVR